MCEARISGPPPNMRTVILTPFSSVLSTIKDGAISFPGSSYNPLLCSIRSIAFPLTAMGLAGSSCKPFSMPCLISSKKFPGSFISFPISTKTWGIPVSSQRGTLFLFAIFAF